MNPATRAITLAALAAALVTGCAGIASKEIEAERTVLHAEPLELDAKGRPVASIAPSGAVTIGEEALSLTDAQRADTAGYRDAVLDLIDLTLDDTRSLTNRAMVTALLGVMTGLGDQAERHIENQAGEIAHTPEFCGLLDDVRRQQDRMVRSVAQLQPYADISEQDVDDCAAGRAYDLNI
ncbi:hypothetical protein [Lysobacter sp. F6437]|uniref:hypothetical protein n=1 Tax=Lysobacter sp. F6437 TaxID=3459296 RepID=UPI00403D5F6E